MPPIHISDPETDKLVRALAKNRSLGVTEAVKLAVRNELLKDGLSVPAADEPQAAQTERASLEAKLEAIIRGATLVYARLLARRRGVKGVGSRVYQMLRRYGAVGTLERLVARPTQGLEFLKAINRLDLSAEHIALDPRFRSILSEDIVWRARENLRKLG
jgi:antitoxin VapB